METTGGLGRFSGTLTSVTSVVENLGVTNPNKKLLTLLFETEDNPRGTGTLYYSRFSLEKMKEIFTTGNFPQLSKDYWEAKNNSNHERCKEIFQQACGFIPAPTEV